MAIAEKSLKSDTTLLDYDFSGVNGDPVLSDLKKSGKRLKDLLGITREDIRKAIKEVRTEW